MKTSMMNKLNLPPVLNFFPLLIFSLLLMTGCKDNDRDLEEENMRLDSLSQELAMYKHTSDSLQALIEKGDIAADYPIYFKKEFDSIENPKEFVIRSLKERPELIPLKPVLGGTMEFRVVKVLTEEWVLGVYDDGHIEGKSIYRYQLKPDGKLKFTHITSREPEE